MDLLLEPYMESIIETLHAQYFCEVFFIVNKIGFANCIHCNTRFISSNIRHYVSGILENASAKRSNQEATFTQNRILSIYS